MVVRARPVASQPRGRDSLLRSSRDHAAIRDREPGQRSGSIAVDDAGAQFGSPTTLRRPLVIAAIDVAEPGRHAEKLAELWRNGADVSASRLSTGEAEQLRLRGLEQIVEEAPGIKQLRLTGADPRLAAEIALASGLRCLHGAGSASAAAMRQGSESGAAAHHWYYVDQLAGWYEASGVPVQRSYAAPLQGMVCPPAVMCASLVLDALVGAEAGVRHVVLELHENRHLQQDVAALRVLPRLASTYLRRAGHDDVAVSAAFKVWGGEWPAWEPDTFGLLGFAVLTASLGGARAVVIGPDPAADIGAVAKRVRFARSALVVTGSQRYPASESIRALEASIEHEAREILDATLALETGELRSAAALAFERGIVELPPAPSALAPHGVRNASEAQWAARA